MEANLHIRGPHGTVCPNIFLDSWRAIFGRAITSARSRRADCTYRYAIGRECLCPMRRVLSIHPCVPDVHHSFMLRYRVFGGVLSAPFPFPELRSVEDGAEADWTLCVEDSPPPELPCTLVGHDELTTGIEAALHQTPRGLRLVFDDTGTFDVTSSGAEVTWYPVANSDRELVRIDILGRVLAVATHEQGLLCLHGSGVAIGGSGIGFLAPKGSGKSTLALTLASLGARLLTDDTLPVDPREAIARPGVHSVRLWSDAAERFGTLGDWRVGLSQKRTFDALPADLVQHDPVPLAALYELIPVEGRAGAPLVQRTVLPAAQATVTLMTHSKLGVLMGGVESIRVFDRCATLASHVPVYRLEVARTLESVESVARTIVGWHS